MKGKIVLSLLMANLLFGAAYAQQGNRHDDSSRPARQEPAARPAAPIRVERAAPPAQIDLSHTPFRNNVGNPEPNRTSHWSVPSNSQPQQQIFSRPSNPQPQQQNFQPQQNFTRPSGSFNGIENNNRVQRTNIRLAPSRFIAAQPAGSNVAHHHHPYTTGYVRKKLQNIGVTAIPTYITDRRGILDADAAHSVLRLPQKGPDHMPLSAHVISSREFTNPMVTSQMAYLHSGSFAPQIAQLTQTETRPNHFYWHTGGSFNYCHYVDNWGYHWYGWYAGDSCFWTRYYADRWWCHDDNLDRWCFWDGDQWWWQDPNHVGDLYVYYNGQYIPSDSANDPVVTTTQTSTESNYNSPDGSRTVKIMANGGDAFLYDTSIPPSFNPIYLASNVTAVQYSDTSDGSPLQVQLTLSDGTTDVFDDQGNPLNYGDDGVTADPQD